MSSERKLPIPEGVKVTMKGTLMHVSGPKGQLERDMRFPQVSVTVTSDEVIIATDSDRKRIMAMVGTYAAHTRNMIIGVTEGFEYHMKVLYSHFPIQLKLQGTRLEINNFLGEKKPRYALLEPGVKATVGNDEIILSGIDKEAVGTSSANIQHATRIRNRDPRVFQDGIYRIRGP